MEASKKEDLVMTVKMEMDTKTTIEEEIEEIKLKEEAVEKTVEIVETVEIAEIEEQEEEVIIKVEEIEKKLDEVAKEEEAEIEEEVVVIKPIDYQKTLKKLKQFSMNNLPIFRRNKELM